MKLILFIAIFVLSGCSALTKAREQNLARVRSGLSREEVVERIGEPREKSQTPPLEVWSYEIYSASGDAARPYLAKFRDGKLQEIVFDTSAYKKTQDLIDQRHSSKQDMIDINNTNGSPAIK